ncbi:hypothetical protein I1A62_22010 [Rhodococcus sp. USK10]|uniref:Uncharacterized protein n=1 Tax=Rhodococcus wratislaviensis TaxID=44752 RepID=A0A402CH30_RHOWR|nr:MULTISPECIES: hypothetical protein [Rhodococcus]QYB06961.1 hypothetical protein I1A62_22010 [Rhodococcus sp. USK10]GCE42910.1 hypothetical protein Rhow_007039 [Rhodococcus wratislaviensis]
MTTGEAVAVSTGERELAEFDTTTSRWGRITMLLGLLLSIGAPLYLVFFGDVDVTAGQLWTAFAAVAGTFFIIWLVEPLTYFPILGPAAMYQAFMIGNIANKLLPAALIAQTNIGAKPGTKRAELAAVLAICGAAMVHLLSLAVFVGLLGTWLISVIPADIVAVTRSYILPSVLGAVLVQAIVSMKQPRATVIALLVAAIITFVVVPAVPSLALSSTGIAVIVTAVLAWFLRNKNDQRPAELATIE